LDRYARQIAFDAIGEKGQQKLLSSKVVILGLGALGSVTASNLARAGVGYLRLIDRDYVEITNLQRQTLYDELNAYNHTPKAIAARSYLVGVNSGIEIESVVADVNSSNVEELISDADLVMDGSDNFEIRYLLNEACHKLKIPWVYGGVLAESGATANIIPGDGPCLRCLSPEMPAPGDYPTCSTAGILNMASGIVACIQSAEAVKILTGAPFLAGNYITFNLWSNSWDSAHIARDLNCSVCAHGRYELLDRQSDTYSTSLCGRDSVQIVPGAKTLLDFARLAQKLKKIGYVTFNSFLLRFESPGVSFHLFPDGRAIIQNLTDEKTAKSVYAEYIGL
jgi:adenylyltransferase/sulfurtransferase